MSAVTLITNGQYGITYTEDPTGYREQWSEGGAEVTRTLRCAWSDRYKFVLDLLGYTNVDPDENGKMIRQIPEQHPFYTWMYAVSANLRGYLGVAGQDSFGVMQVDAKSADGSTAVDGSFSGTGYAVYDVTYRMPEYQIKKDTERTTELDRFVIRDYKYSIENLRLPGQGFAWGALADTGSPAGTAIPSSIATKAIPQPTTKPFPTSTLIYTWLQVPQIYPSKLSAALGKVNSTAFDTSSGNFSAETLLFNSVEIRRVRHANSTYYWQLAYQFIYRATGWNKLYSRVGEDFYKVTKASGAGGIYDTYEFANLFVLSS